MPFTLRRKHCVLLILCTAVLITVFVVNCVLFNVHLSPYYVQHRARLFPANFNITSECPWNTQPHNFSDFKPRPLVLIAHALSDINAQFGIKSVLRDGSLLHAYRHISADQDMDIWMIIPKNMTLSYGYDKVRQVMKQNKSYSDITFEQQNLVLMSVIFHYSDSVRISYKGMKLVDISVLHETFINDPDLQTPCLKKMECARRDRDPEFLRYYHLIKTKKLFENLCKCRFMDAELFCLSAATEYLKLRYGKNFTTPIGKNTFVKPRDLIYERPFKLWRYVVSNLPILKRIIPLIEGHSMDSFNITDLRR